MSGDRPVRKYENVTENVGIVSIERSEQIQSMFAHVYGPPALCRDRRRTDRSDAQISKRTVREHSQFQYHSARGSWQEHVGRPAVGNDEYRLHRRRQSASSGQVMNVIIFHRDNKKEADLLRFLKFFFSYIFQSIIIART